MALFGRNVSGAKPKLRTGNRRADATLETLLFDIAEHGRQGHDSYAFQISTNDVGGQRIEYITSNFTQHIQAEGHTVLSVSPEPWTGTVQYTVRPGTLPASGHGPNPGATAESLVEAIAAAVPMYRQWLRAGDLAAIWRHREGLEGRITAERPKTTEGLDAFNVECGSNRFWVNALPAFAGLELGYKSGSSVFQYAGDADASVNRADNEQQVMMDAIDQRARHAF